MTGKTHEMAALAAVSLAATRGPLPPLDLLTIGGCFAVTLLGGLAPDLDKPGSSLWRRMPAGWLLAWLARPAFVGGHRHLSHSLLGAGLFALGARALLASLPPGRSGPLWACFLIAYLSHLVMDSLTEDGVPWFFPFGERIGFPPVRAWRIKTSGWFEDLVVLPALLVTVLQLWRTHLPLLLAALRGR